MRGNAIAFRYKDWGDYKATGQAIANGDGTTTLFQLIKTYGDYYKPIRRPVTDTVKVYLDGVLQTSGFIIYYSVGVIQFAEPPDSGVEISADFEFDLVVRFENENLSSRFDAYDASHPEEALYDVPAIFLIEVLPAIASSNVSGGGSSIGEYRWACSGGSCYPTDDNTAPYPTQSACEAALILPFVGGQCRTRYNPLVVRSFTYQNGLGGTVTDVSEPQNNGSFVGPLISWGIELNGRAPSGFGEIIAETRRAGVSGDNDLITDQTIGDFFVDGFGNRFPRTDFEPEEIYYKLKSASLAVFSLTRVDGMDDDCGDPPKQCPA